MVRPWSETQTMGNAVAFPRVSLPRRRPAGGGRIHELLHLEKKRIVVVHFTSPALGAASAGFRSLIVPTLHQRVRRLQPPLYSALFSPR